MAVNRWMLAIWLSLTVALAVCLYIVRARPDSISGIGVNTFSNITINAGPSFEGYGTNFFTCGCEVDGVQKKGSDCGYYQYYETNDPNYVGVITFFVTGVVIAASLVFASCTCLKTHSSRVYMIVWAGIMDLVSDIFYVLITPWRCDLPLFRMTGTIFIILPIALTSIFYFWKIILAPDSRRFFGISPVFYRTVAQNCCGDAEHFSCFQLLNPFFLISAAFIFVTGLLNILIMPFEILLIPWIVVGQLAVTFVQYAFNHYFLEAYKRLFKKDGWIHRNLSLVPVALFAFILTILWLLLTAVALVLLLVISCFASTLIILIVPVIWGFMVTLRLNMLLPTPWRWIANTTQMIIKTSKMSIGAVPFVFNTSPDRLEFHLEAADRMFGFKREGPGDKAVINRDESLTLLAFIFCFELVTESIPQLIIQGRYNTVEDGWSFFAVLSFTISAFIALSGAWGLLYRRYGQNEPFKEILSSENAVKRLKSRVDVINLLKKFYNKVNGKFGNGMAKLETEPAPETKPKYSKEHRRVVQSMTKEDKAACDVLQLQVQNQEKLRSFYTAKREMYEATTVSLSTLDTDIKAVSWVRKAAQENPYPSSFNDIGMRLTDTNLDELALTSITGDPAAVTVNTHPALDEALRWLLCALIDVPAPNGSRKKIIQAMQKRQRDMCLDLAREGQTIAAFKKQVQEGMDETNQKLRELRSQFEQNSQDLEARIQKAEVEALNTPSVEATDLDEVDNDHQATQPQEQVLAAVPLAQSDSTPRKGKKKKSKVPSEAHQMQRLAASDTTPPSYRGPAAADYADQQPLFNSRSPKGAYLPSVPESSAAIADAVARPPFVEEDAMDTGPDYTAMDTDPDHTVVVLDDPAGDFQRRTSFRFSRESSLT
eukprot:m.225213 g.225213  ORF g.225213 m.225213 type:complete len:883 (+) comp17305_c0_seq2:149-2797(+)